VSLDPGLTRVRQQGVQGLSAAAAEPAPPPALDRDVPVLIVRIGHYKPHHGTTGLIRSLGRLGVPVYAITASARARPLLSRYLTGALAWPTTGLEGEAELVRGLRRVADRLGRPTVAVANDDEAAILLAEHRDEFAGRLIGPPVGAGLPRRLADKKGMYELCRRHSVPTPRSAFPDTADELDEAVAHVGLPAVVKNRAPFDRLDAPVVPATTVLRSREDVEAVKRAMARPGCAKILIQEYLPTDAATARDHPPDWFVHLYCDAASRALVCFTGVKLRAWPAGGGVTARGLALANPELAEISARFCRAIGFCGLGDLDWRFDSSTGRFNLVDFNPRTGAQAQVFRTRAGVDGVREREATEEAARGLGHHADGGAPRNVEAGLAHEVLVHDGVEVRVVHDVVHVSVRIVVHPARRDAQEVREVGADGRLPVRCHGARTPPTMRSSRSSIQWRTGRRVPAARCVRHPMFAVAITAG